LLASGQKYYGLGTWQLVNEKGPNAIWKHSPVHSLKRGEYDASITHVILGVNQDEGTMFSLALDTRDPEKLKASVQRYPEGWHQPLEMLYGISKASDKDSLVECAGSHLLADSIFLAPFVHSTKMLTTVPNSQTGKLVPVRTYRLDVAPEAYRNHPVCGPCGVMHSVDLSFTFNNNSLWSADSNDAKISQAIGERFLKFAKDGDIEDWPLHDAQTKKTLVFQDAGETKVESLEGFRQGQMDFWSKVIEAKASSTVEEDAFPAAKSI